MNRKIFRFCFACILVLTLNACSIAGSWLYERLDSYIADYFKDYAEFTKDQNQRIDQIAKDFHDWFTENELTKIRILLAELKEIDLQEPKKKIVAIYKEGELLFERSNDYFEEPIISFTKTLTEDQITQIGEHFEKIRNEREEEREREDKEYKERLLDNYESGFSRIGINLREEQIDTLKIRLNEHIEIREEWSKFQKEWVEDFILLLRENQTPNYDSKMAAYLRSFEDLGDDEFRTKMESNEELTIELLSYVLRTADDGQIKGFKRSLDTYLKSINRILSNRKIN